MFSWSPAVCHDARLLEEQVLHKDMALVLLIGPFCGSEDAYDDDDDGGLACGEGKKWKMDEMCGAQTGSILNTVYIGGTGYLQNARNSILCRFKKSSSKLDN